jgi:Fur family transcriptional regulator, stress-responsive regulator
MSIATRPDDLRLVDQLRERGQRVTSQRVLIHRVLVARDQHLTAEQVLDAVSEQLPGIALPTVYATLELFEELGLVRRVVAGTGAVLFDSRVDPHAHAVCRRCGAVIDIEEPVRPMRAVELAAKAGFTADHVQMVIWGICADCRGASSS